MRRGTEMTAQTPLFFAPLFDTRPTIECYDRIDGSIAEAMTYTRRQART